MSSLPTYPVDQPIHLPGSDQWPASVHRLDATTATALRTAEVTGRPLLLRGRPGVGKSMTARAAAAAARRPFLCHVIDSRTEPEDLMYRFDQVARLADAQVLKPDSALPPDDHYLSPRSLWWAFDWAGAGDRLGGLSRPPAEMPDGWDPGSDRAVLLIDEIDKADPELPNALLEAFGSLSFTVPVTGQRVVCDVVRRPLVIITTNEDRDLPHAFLRRCLVHRLALPREHDALVRTLAAIARDHFGQDGIGPGSCEVIHEAAEQVAVARLTAIGTADYLPGTSELLDLVAALSEMWPGDRAAQLQQLETLKQFVLRKSSELDA